MLNKLKSLFSEHPSMERLTLIIRPEGDSMTLSVVPKVTLTKKHTGSDHRLDSELQISSFVIKGTDSELQEALSGGFVDLVANDIVLGHELQEAELRKKKAIDDARKAEESAKKKVKDLKEDDLSKLRAENERLKKELENSRAQPSLF